MAKDWEWQGMPSGKGRKFLNSGMSKEVKKKFVKRWSSL